ncbi:hypothetical protein QYG89_00435 [Bacillus sp. B190/17]|uniref:Uncharacterized protein n=1 Tax=Bacillus lumedeiriae TaxID=3058829 RepID=A0ABW8I3U9_9BACI
MSFNERKQEIIRRFHVCATCRYFQPVKQETGMRYDCSRLKYETKPTYQFHCWNPKDHVVTLLKKKIEQAKKVDDE